MILTDCATTGMITFTYAYAIKDKDVTTLALGYFGMAIICNLTICALMIQRKHISDQ